MHTQFNNILTISDLNNPDALLNVFRKLLHETWRYAPSKNSSYAKELPVDYVVDRIVAMLDRESKDCLGAKVMYSIMLLEETGDVIWRDVNISLPE